MGSDVFPSSHDVKQGCLLSTILFSLFSNDVPDYLPNSLQIAGMTIKVLMYADDIILLSDYAKELQEIITYIHTYLAQTPEIGQGLGRFQSCEARKQEQT